MSTKKALKSIQLQIKDQSFEAALHEATTLLKALKKDDQEAAQVLCYRGLALSYLDRKEEAEKCYVQAYTLQPSNQLARKALPKLYEKEEAWDRWGLYLERLVQDTYELGEAEQCAQALAELLTLRQQHGPEDKLFSALRLLLPSSPLVPFLQPLDPPKDTYTPIATPAYPSSSVTQLPPLSHPLHLLGSLAILLHLLIRQESLLSTEVESKIKAARTKLGAKSEKETRRDVEAAVLGGEMGSEMVDLLGEVAAHPGVEDAVRRLVEINEFDYWKKLVGVLSNKEQPPKPKSKQEAAHDGALAPASFFSPPVRSVPSKSEALSRANALAEGFILLELAEPAEAAYSWVLEGTDAPDQYPLDLLHQYAVKFPDSHMGGFIDDYCRWFSLPPPPAGDEDGKKDDGVEKVEVQKRGKKKAKGMNARERRKARRQAGQEGTLTEDVEAEERDELVASMTKSLDKLPKSIFAHRVMARVSIQEEDWANAVAYAEKGRLLLKELETDRGTTLAAVRTSLDAALGMALVPYYPPKHHTRAARLLNGALAADAENHEARFSRGQIFQHAQAWSEARKNFQQILDRSPEERMEISTTEEIGWCIVNEGRLEEGRNVLEEIVMRRVARWERDGSKEGEDAFGRARGWFRLGKTEWMLGSKTQAEEWFTASLRALTTFAPSFTALGVLYADAGDAERSLKCYQQAFELDPTEAFAAEQLATGYANDDEWARVRAIAVRVMEGEGGVDGVAGGDAMGKARFAPKNGWAWKALGSTEMYYRNYVKAAQSFQVALRALPNDVATHVLLAESYIKSGKHMAALKTLDRVLEIDPDHWIAKYDQALIQTELGNYSAAIEIYEGLADKGEIGILAALAGAWLNFGRQMRDGGFRARARNAFESAIQRTLQVIVDRQYRAWAWKVIGDAAFELADLGDSDVLQSVIDTLVAEDADRRSAIVGLGHAGEIGDVDALRTAVFSFSWRAYLLRDERAPVVMSALYDLSAALHSLARTAEGDEKEAATKAAIGAIRRALDKDSSDERLWNALGVLCAQGGEGVAQHAFVVSLELYEKDPITWSNLGFMYLTLDEPELANQCLLKSQTLDPDYARAWLGQGLLADKSGDKDQARSLFGHSVTLAAGSLLEADLAAAASLFERYLTPGWYDIGDLHQPAFALKRYIHRRPTNSAATHLYGLISERLGLMDEAAEAFETAVSLLEQEFEQSESAEIEERYSNALVNLGRVRLATKSYPEAIETYTSAWDLVHESPKLRAQVRLGLAVAKYWTGDVDGCLEEFENALQEADGGEEGLKESVAVLLARTLWSLGEDGREVAKGHLLECLATSDIHVVSTLGAIALATDDDDLLDAVSSEIAAMPIDKRLADRSDHAGLVLSTHSLIQGDTEGATTDLAQSLSQDPWNATTRARLARLYIALGRSEDAQNLLYMDMRGTESELTGLRGMARLLMGEKAGTGEVMRAVRGKPWNEARWGDLKWAVETAQNLQEPEHEEEREQH